MVTTTVNCEAKLKLILPLYRVVMYCGTVLVFLGVIVGWIELCLYDVRCLCYCYNGSAQESCDVVVYRDLISSVNLCFYMDVLMISLLKLFNFIKNLKLYNSILIKTILICISAVGKTKFTVRIKVLNCKAAARKCMCLLILFWFARDFLNNVSVVTFVWIPFSCTCSVKWQHCDAVSWVISTVGKSGSAQILSLVLISSSYRTEQLMQQSNIVFCRFFTILS